MPLNLRYLKVNLPIPMMATKPSICFTLTSPFALSVFLLGHIERLRHHAHITVCLNRDESDIPIQMAKGVLLNPVKICRKISPFHDLLALLNLWMLYRKQRYSMVLSMTPKGGLLGMIAAKSAGIPIRIHYFTGQVWVTKRGLSRLVLKAIDRLIATCATHILADSPTQLDLLISQGIVSPQTAVVLGDGSISGVDISRFKPDPSQRARIRQELGIAPEARCLLYVGRMKREKGILDLITAFNSLRKKFSDLQLILAGPDEEGLLVNLDTPGIHIMGYAKNVEDYMAAADIFCLPSYREGFGSVLIEAAATGLPSVASRIYGIIDAVIDGETGLLHRPQDPLDLTSTLATLLENPEAREKMAETGRLRALSKFSSDHVEGLLVTYLMNIISKKGDCCHPARNFNSSLSDL